MASVTSTTLKRRKRTAPTSEAQHVVAASSSVALRHPLSPFHWIQRLRDAERNPVSAEVKTLELVQCIVLFPDHTAIVVDRVPVWNISASLWCDDGSQDKDFNSPLDLENRVLAEPLREDNIQQTRQGVYMVHNNHSSNPYEINVTATRILSDGGLLELGCVPATRVTDDPRTETVDAFFRRVTQHCASLCPKGPVVFVLTDISGKEGPVPLPFSATYFNQVFPMLFRDSHYMRMLAKCSLFATLNRSVETLLALNGSTAQGQYRYIHRETARATREVLFRDIWGYSENRIRALVKSQIEEPELNATICVLVHAFSMSRWQSVSRCPVLR